MAMMAHIRATIGNLEDEIRRQFERAQDFYEQMERIGLEEELGDEITQTALQSLSPRSDNSELLPPYRRTPSPLPVPSVRRRPTPIAAIVFPEIPSRSPSPQQPHSSRQTTPSRSNPIGTRRNP